MNQIGALVDKATALIVDDEIGNYRAEKKLAKEATLTAIKIYFNPIDVFVEWSLRA